jgi:hypothetical protein
MAMKIAGMPHVAPAGTSTISAGGNNLAAAAQAAPIKRYTP